MEGAEHNEGRPGDAAARRSAQYHANKYSSFKLKQSEKNNLKQTGHRKEIGYALFFQIQLQYDNATLAVSSLDISKE